MLAAVSTPRGRTASAASDGARRSSDGPYYLNSFSFGTGVPARRPNPVWYGAESERQHGELDASSRTRTPRRARTTAMRSTRCTRAPATSLTQYIGQGGTVYSVDQRLRQEHVDMNVAAKSLDHAYTPNLLMKNAWFRQAIMLGINRQAIINDDLQRDRPWHQAAGQPGVLHRRCPDEVGHGQVRVLHQFNYNTKSAIKLLKAHCTGGPSVAEHRQHQVLDVRWQVDRHLLLHDDPPGSADDWRDRAGGAEGDRHQGQHATSRVRGVFFGTTTLRAGLRPRRVRVESAVRIRPASTRSTSASTRRRASVARTARTYCNHTSDHAATTGDSYLPSGSPTRYGLYETEAKLCADACA